MKIKSLLLSFVLGLTGLLAVFGLAGCGDTSLATIKENYQKLNETYAQYAEVFKTGVCEGLNTKYLISYGSVVDNYVDANKSGYVELESRYNMMLAISNDYIDNNIAYVTNFEEKELSGDSKSAINKLNEKLVEYTNSISNFVNARNSFVTYFSEFNGQLNEEADAAYLRRFKKSYGDLVSKNINLSMSLAKAIETTEIFNLLKNTEPTENDTNIIKEYIRAKMLPIFSEFMVTEIENNLNWSATPETESKSKIDELLSSLSTAFDSYKQHFVTSNTNSNKMTTKEVNDLFKMIEEFFVETDSYYKALKELNISTFAINFDFDMKKYKEQNQLAEVYLEKLEQFINFTLNNFTTNALTLLGE